ncbi:hypothetical protein DFH06DRAFT_579466 [Mycena polygramma]|nr:hypothetical protein DFH06DRAFT_579466 [Mycena polygramma]
MIITEDTPQSPGKDSSTPLLGGAGGSSASAPPAYAPRGAGPSPLGSSQVPYTPYQPVHTQPAHTQRREGESAGQRFCKAFLVAFGVWILLTMLFGSIADSGVGHFEYPIPPGVDAGDCETSWSGELKHPGFTSYPYSASTSFRFSLPSKSLLLLSKGDLSNGNLKITTSDSADKVSVNVTVNYHKSAVRDAAKICFIQRNDGESGVGIFTPLRWRSRSHTDRLSFDVELVLPRALINALSTDVNNFSHDIDNLLGVLGFGDLALKATNGRIQAKALSANTAALSTTNGAVSLDSLIATTVAVRSSNAPISGAYVVADSLALQTTNGRIDAAVTVSVNGAKSTKDVALRTTNSALDAVINLYDDKAGKFDIVTETTNGALSTKIAAAPLDSTIVLKAKTSNHRASVALPATYEGSFSVATSNAAVVVEDSNSEAQDPACTVWGECRTRTVHTTSVTKRSAAGHVHWDEKNANRGKVTLATTNGRASLSL